MPSPADQVGLKGQAAGLGVDEGAHAVVGHRQQRCAQPVPARELARDARERPACLQSGRAPEVGREVAIAELEPGGLAQASQRAEAGEGLAGQTPATVGIRSARERVEDGVEIGRDVEPEELLVVPRIADDGETPGINAP